jgi:arylsulfatase A-like enzyme
MGKQKSKFSRNKYFLSSIVIVIILAYAAFLFPLNKQGKGWKGFDKTSIEDYNCKDCNVIIISITNLRNDHLGYNGYFRDTSPNIDKLAANSLIFENTFSHASWTLPAGISFFTSLYPFTHKIMDRWTGQTVLDDATATLPEILEENGYLTVAFTGGFDYSGKYGLISRFNYSSYPEVDPIPNQRYGNFEDNLQSAIKWLETHREEKFLLFFQGFNAHCPFAYPTENKVFDQDYNGSIDYSDCLWTFEKVEPIVIKNKTYYNVKTSYSQDNGYGSVRLSERDIEHMVALYDGEIQLVDNMLNQFFDEIIKLGLEKDTIIILFSEHGDLFGEHGRFMRGGPLRGTFYDEVLHVPLIIKHPTLKPKRINGLVQLIDVTPTLLDFLGIPKKEAFEGKSLMPLITNNEEVNEFVFAGSRFIPPSNNVFFNKSSIVQVVRTKEYKLVNEKLFDKNYVVLSDDYEFYNLSADPSEVTNIYSTAEPELKDYFLKKIRDDSPYPFKSGNSS